MDDDNYDDKCAICLEHLNSRDICRLKPCGHKFCHSCIKVWLNNINEIKKSCPLCRTKANEVAKPSPYYAFNSESYFPVRYSQQYRSGTQALPTGTYEQRLRNILTEEKTKLEQTNAIRPLSNKELRRLLKITREIEALSG